MRELRVAVIEDDASMCALLRDVLLDAEMEVEAVMSRTQLRSDWHGDVLLTDGIGRHYEPGVVRAYVASLRREFGVPVVVLTAHAEAVLDAAVLGAAAVIAKPFRIDHLVATIRTVVDAGSAGTL